METTFVAGANLGDWFETEKQCCLIFINSRRTVYVLANATTEISALSPSDQMHRSIPRQIETQLCTSGMEPGRICRAQVI